MIRKNVFLILNNVVCELYRCQTYAELGQFFLPVLRMLIPFRYASIMRRENTTEHIRLVDPLCIPSEFLEAEQNYMRFADDDYTGWLNCCRESTLFRESDLVGEQQRLREPCAGRLPCDKPEDDGGPAGGRRHPWRLISGHPRHRFATRRYR